MATRAELGQWYTPPRVASLVIRLAIEGLGPKPRILDPSCGDGVFFRSAIEMGVDPIQMVGIELDKDAASEATKSGAEIVSGSLFDDLDQNKKLLRPSSFDAIVGNPPYVRQERLSKEFKSEIARSLDSFCAFWDDSLITKLLGRGDLAVFCLLRTIGFAKPGARLVFVLSSALLDASYAKIFWEMVGSNCRVLAILDSPKERWFSDAAIKAMIVVLEKKEVVGDGASGSVLVARFPENVKNIESRIHSLGDVERLFPSRKVSQNKPEHWKVALRAHPTWFSFSEAAREFLVPLSELAEIKRGMTTGANSIFYLSQKTIDAWCIEEELLLPLFRVPRNRSVTNIKILPEELPLRVLLAPKERSRLECFPGATAYIDSHTENVVSSTLKARNPWWALSARPANLFLTKAYGVRFAQYFCDRGIVADQRVYGLYPKGGVSSFLLAAIMNSTFTAFALESLGRASMGHGALEWTVGDAESLPVVDIRKLDKRKIALIEKSFNSMLQEPIGDVLTESTNIRRQKLDSVILECLPFFKGGTAAIYEALISAVSMRNDGSGSTDSN